MKKKRDFAFFWQSRQRTKMNNERFGIPELRTMARTIRNNLEGINTYWTFLHLTNASTEGFNNKIRWLIRQAYGFRDREYLKLKIYQLPEISCVKEV